MKKLSNPSGWLSGLMMALIHDNFYLRACVLFALFYAIGKAIPN
jgi:hypothetical protein